MIVAFSSLPSWRAGCFEGYGGENAGGHGDEGSVWLHATALEGHLPVVQYLCEQGGDKEARDEGGQTPIFID